MSEFDQRQYQLMLDRLVAFEHGRIRLDSLVDDLDGLLNALKGIEPAWKRSFLHQWGRLEVERAFALSENITAFDEETTRRLLEAVVHLKLIVGEKMK